MLLNPPSPATAPPAISPTQGAVSGGTEDFLPFSQHPLTCLLNNPGVEFHRPGIQQAVGYFRYGNTDICLGGMVAPPAQREALLDSYLADTARRGATPIFVHFSDADAELLNQRGYMVNQLGASYAIQLADYDMAGKRFQQLRNKIHRAAKAGAQVKLIDSMTEFRAVKPALVKVTSSWLAQKGAKPLKGLVTDFDSLSIPSPRHRLYVATVNQEIVAYVCYTRTWGDSAGWFHDLSRKLPDTPDGIMQLINQTALDAFTREGCSYLHFGFTPLVEMDRDIAFTGSPAFAKIARWMARKGGVVYPAASQRQYKMSWRPQLITTEYIGFPKGKALKALWSVLRSTNSI